MENGKVRIIGWGCPKGGCHCRRSEACYAWEVPIPDGEKPVEFAERVERDGLEVEGGRIKAGHGITIVYPSGRKREIRRGY